MKSLLQTYTVAERIAIRREYASAPPTALFTPTQVSVVLGRTVRTLEAWRNRSGKGPVYTLLGVEGTIRYRKRDVEKWIADGGPANQRRGAK